MPKKDNELSIPTGPRVLRSRLPVTRQVTDSNKSNKRALDALDRKLSQISNKKKNGSPVTVNTVPWLMNKSPSSEPAKSSIERSKIPIIPVGPRMRLRLQNDKSPTPKRRKRSLKINNNDDENDYDFLIPKDVNISSDISSLGLSIDDIAEHEMIQSSPIRKSVAFSNNIEELEKIKSSPIQSTTKKPFKSILRIKNDKKLVNSISMSDLQTETSKKTLFLQEPYLTHSEYWSSGEVHQLSDKNNLTEFKNIINSGLINLENDVGMKFEIYATFNNILPVNNKYGTNNNNIQQPNNIDNLKIDFLISALPRIMKVSIDDLVSLQPEIITISENKDAFNVRTYIQIVKFISFILSNQTIVQVIPNSPHVLERINLVYKACIQALENQHCSKQIIITHINFLKDELFGEKHFTSQEKQFIVDVIVKIRELKSMNLVTEKLSLIKSLLRKYRYAMLKDIVLWLPGEVIPRLLLHNIEHGWSIVESAISILLDLLKIYRELSFNHTQVYSCIELSDMRTVVPKKFVGQLGKLMKTPSDQKTTLGTIIRNHIKILTNQGNFKIANDIWLATIGLLYNKDNICFLSESSHEYACEWIKVNRICFSNPDSTARLQALKVWRVVIHGVYVKLWNDPISIKDIESMYKLLQIPFDMALQTQVDDSSLQGLQFLLHILSFTTSRLSYNKSSTIGTQYTNWFKTVQSIYMKLFSYPNNVLRISVLRSIFRLLDSTYKLSIKPNIVNSGNDSALFGSKMVLTASGISPSAISCIDPQYSRIVLCEISKGLKINVDDQLGSTEVNEIEKKTSIFPQNLFTLSMFREFSQILIFYYSQNADSFLNPMDFVLLPTALVTLFSDVLFYENTSDYLIDFLTKLDYVYPLDKKNSILEQLFKNMFKTFSTNDNIYLVTYAFLCIDNTLLRDIIHQSLGQLSSPITLTLTQMYYILKILSFFPNSVLLEKFYSIIFEEKCNLIMGNYNFLKILRMESWNLNQIITFTINYYAHDRTNSNGCVLAILEELFKRDTNIFYYIAPIMEMNGDINKLKITVNENPQLIENSLFFEMPFFTEILSKSLEKKLIKDLRNFPKWKQINIMKKFIMKKPQMFLRAGRPVIMDFVKFAGPLSGEGKSVAIEILKACYKCQMVSFANKLMDMFLSNDNVTVVVDFLYENDGSNKKIWDDKILVKLASKTSRIREDLIMILKKEFDKRTTIQKISLIDNIIKEKDMYLFKSCIKEIFRSFIQAHTNLVSTDERLTKTVFGKVVEFVLFNHDYSSVFDITDLYVDMLPKELSEENIEDIKCFLSMLPKRNEKFKKDIELPRMKDLTNIWKCHTEKQINKDMSTSEVSSILTPEGLYDSAQESNTTNQKVDLLMHYFTDYIAEYKLKDSSILSSQTCPSLPEVVESSRVENNLIPAISFSESHPSTLQEVDLNCSDNSKRLSQSYLAKSTQLSQKNMANADMNENTLKHNIGIQEHTIQIKGTNIQGAPEAQPSTEVNTDVEDPSTGSDVRMSDFRVISGYLERTHFTEERNKISETSSPIIDSQNDSSSNHNNILETPIEEERHSKGKLSSKGTIVSSNSKDVTNENGSDTPNNTTSRIANNSAGGSMDKIHESRIVVSSGSVSISNNDKEVERSNNLDNPNSSSAKNVNGLVKNVSKPVNPADPSKRIENLSEDFERVIPDGDDEFLKEMENLSVLLDQPVSSSPVKESDVKTTGTSQGTILQKGKSSIHNIMQANLPQGAIGTETAINTTPCTDRTNHTDKVVEDSEKEPKGIKIPIFNSRRMNPVNTRPAKISPRKKSLRYANKSTVINVNIPKTFRRSVSPEPIIRHPTMTDSFGNDLIISDLSQHNSPTSSSFASLKDDVSSKKARKLLSRMRSISSSDLATLSPDERRNMRVEMLDFLMKLEHPNSNGV
ncbi:similar to Saccharomyces cerevisiae YBR275C RIF1 Protein that binds to the Rap1p C-terminus and acts synergistically with Rif2p to help control telomere length and establish telomeric silencing [Maudiozyma saulgeensis]|uniref:Similar to Saccharomyces cerevisiae YBR275C RIF1 Protein that binds to the Rap1p C-terminus and acts synergistically with Rif2p to help control telomere length and establish telomeric silencing n=1 Tax=Maudiozyma saulgeensis TaxID=1789683 RepID=A0A1X7R1D9_9SACH|nr:similar to Saccharomyces cerevisiae YBR275C RIF1 Protein that binds to the Rap1p C-terminus and acts synergistically with Rif2p to help control telomere length and establish telomeric silencing [Kazachstania saulgeensis]